MTRVLATEDGAGLGHHLLDERVTDPGAHRGASCLPHDLGHRLGADQVVDDRRPRFPLQDRASHHRGGERTRDGPGRLVDEEHPVGVAVEGESDVGPRLEQPVHQIPLVLGLDRIGRVIGERSVELGIEMIEPEREAGEHGRDDEAAHPVGRVGHDLERPERRYVDEGADVGHVAVEHVALGARAATTGRIGAARGDLPGGLLDDLETGVGPDGRRLGEAHLDPVVARRVVRRGEDGAGNAQVARRVVEHVGGAQADIDHVETLRQHPVPERRGELLAVGAHVPADRDRTRPGTTDEAGEGATDGPRAVGVELVGNRPSHVVGLEDRVEVGGHGGDATAARARRAGSRRAGRDAGSA